MSDDPKRRRPKFEEAATLISEPGPLWDQPPGTPRYPAAPTPAETARPGAVEFLEVNTAEIELAETPAVGTQVPQAGVIEIHGAAPAQLSAPSPFLHRAAGAASPDPTIVLVHAPDSPAAAQWRLLKFKLKEHGDPRVIAITSASRGEGKSVAAANLALCLAEGQRSRVVLLETNLRSPALASLLGVEIPFGLTDQLRRRRRDPDAPWELYELASNFLFLPGGRPAENPAAMLGSEQFGALVRDLRLYYDFVVVDTPGTLVAADMNIIQDLVEGVVLVCRGGLSTRGQLKKALDRLAQHNLIGLVLADSR